MRIRPTLIVLAAGSGVQLGAQLGAQFSAPQQQLAQGVATTTVLGSTVQSALQTLLPLLVVTTPRLSPLARSLVALRDVLVLPNEAMTLGQAIAAGVAERSGSQGWLVIPGDLPLMQPQTLLAMASALEVHPVVQPEFEGQAGPAVGFSTELYSELVKLQGEEGARRIVARYPVHHLAVADSGVLQAPAPPAKGGQPRTTQQMLDASAA